MTTTTGAGQAAQSSSSKEAPKTLEEKGKEMMKKKKEEKDPGMSYTTMVLESLRSQENPQARAHTGSWEERKKVQQKQNLDKISTEISRTAVGTAPLPSLLMGKLLNAQPYESPVEGWVEGMYHPVRKPDGVIVLPFPEAAGVFQWTFFGESDLQRRPKKAMVPLPNPEALGIDTLIYFWEKTWCARIPWNEGLRAQIEAGNLGTSYPLDPDRPVKKEGRVPMLSVPTLLSDVNKIAWMRAFLGWAYRCVKTHSPEGAMPPHSDLVHFIVELYACVTVAVAKPLSACGQGIPVYAAGTEIRTGSDGLKTSDWGNDIFIEAAKSVSPGIFVQVGDNKSDRGDRVESLFNISFWTKEGAIDWNWLGLDTPGKEREADSLAVAMEWKCYKIAERALVDFFVDSPWVCSMSVLRVLQMCEADDLSVLQMPKTCPWCNHVLKLEGMSLYTQIWTYLDHARTTVKWPSVAETTMVFIAKCVGKAREEFIRQIAALRLRQRSVQKEDQDALL